MQGFGMLQLLPVAIQHAAHVGGFEANGGYGLAKSIGIGKPAANGGANIVDMDGLQALFAPCGQTMHR